MGVWAVEIFDEAMWQVLFYLGVAAFVGGRAFYCDNVCSVTWEVGKREGADYCGAYRLEITGSVYGLDGAQIKLPPTNRGQFKCCIL